MIAGSTVSPAFAGFRLVREHPRVIAVWGLLSLLFSLGEGVFAAANAGPDVMRILGQAGSANPNPDVLLLGLGRIAPTYCAVLVANMGFQALLLAALNRAAETPRADRIGYLRFGVDELRQFGLIACLLIVTIGAYLVLAVLGGIVSAASGLSGLPGLGAPVAAIVIGLGYMLMRLSLASPLTFTERRISVFGSWALTRERQWGLARTFLISCLLAGAVYCLAMTLIIALMAVAFGGVGQLTHLLSPDLSSVRSFLTPSTITLIVMQSAVTALILPVVLCPAIEIYRGSTPVPNEQDIPPTSSNSPWG